MVCPADTTLSCFRLCGQLDPACCVGGVMPEAIITISLQPGEAGSYICDPTTNAMVIPGLVETIVLAEGSDGCWCSCPLPPTQADDPDMALQPSGSTYTITIAVGGRLVASIPGFTLDLEDATGAETDTFACGECVPLKLLLPPLPTIPPTAVFCTAVLACTIPPTLTGPAAGALTFTDGRGGSSTHQLISTDADNSIIAGADGALYSATVIPVTYDLSPTIDQTAGTITLTGSDGTSDPALILSQDTGQIIGYGGDGGLFVDCASVQACVTLNYVAFDPAAHVAGTAVDGSGTTADPWQIPLPPTNVVTTDGTATGVTQSGVGDHVIDLVVTSGDTGNVATIGADGGTYVACEAIQDCVGTALGAVDGLNYDDANDAITVCLSTDAGNQLEIGSDGCLNVPPASAETPLVVTTNGDTTGVTQSGTSDHIADILLLSGVAGNILSTEVDGALYLDCAAVAACVTIPDNVVTTDGTATGVTQSGVNDHVIDITLLSSQAGNDLTLGPDGGLFIDVAADVNTTYDLDPLINQGDGTASLRGSDATVDPLLILSQDTGQIIAYGGDGGLFMDCAAVAACVTIPDNVVTTDGTPLGVTQSGTNDHTIDIVLLSTDPANAASTGADGGIFVPQAAADQNTTYDLTPLIDQTNGTITLTGSDATSDPSLILSQDAGQIIEYGADGGLFMDCAAVQACVAAATIPDVVVTTNGDATGVTQSGTNDHTVDILLLSGVAGNILSTEADGALYLDCVAVNACVTPTVIPDNVVTTDGTATGVTQSGTNDHTIDIVLLSGDAGQIATTGTDGGVHVDCDDVLACVNVDYVAFDRAAHVAGNALGTGTAADPFQVPLPCCVDRFDVDYCGFDTTATNPPRLVRCTGSITGVDLVTTTPPNGGNEIFTVLLDGAPVGTITLNDGATTASLAAVPFAVTPGQVIEVEMTSTTAGGASGTGSLMFTQECD